MNTKPIEVKVSPKQDGTMASLIKSFGRFTIKMQAIKTSQNGKGRGCLVTLQSSVETEEDAKAIWVNFLINNPEIPHTLLFAEWQPHAVCISHPFYE